MQSKQRPEPAPEKRPPWQQVLMDDVFLLVGLGLVIPILIYVMWGLMDLASLEPFRP